MPEVGREHGPHGVPHEVGAVETEVIEQAGQIFNHLPAVAGRVGELAAPPEAPHVHGNDAVARGERVGDTGSPLQAVRVAVDEDDRLAAPGLSVTDPDVT